MSAQNGATPPPSLPGHDPANPLMAQCPVFPAALSAETVKSPQGDFLRVCVRTPDLTAIVQLTRDDADAWGKFLRQQAAGMSGLILPGGIG